MKLLKITNKIIQRITTIFVVGFLANIRLIANLLPFKKVDWVVFLAILFFLMLCIKPAIGMSHIQTKRLKRCQAGCEQIVAFLITIVITLAVMVLAVMEIIKTHNFGVFDWFWYILIAFVVEFVLFWNGIIRIYLNSGQLAFRWRVIGIIAAYIPIVNVIVLGKLVKIVLREVNTENDKIILNQKRKEEKICETKYPLLLIHGVFFRDFDHLNYWGRIPKELEENGAKIYYGNQTSADSIEDTGLQIAERIKQIVNETGCEKVNIIAHSKGGLDARYAISLPGMEQYVASLITVSTPHRGCEFADYLLNKIPDERKQKIAHAYNAALTKAGDINPDFLKAVTDLTKTSCNRINNEIKDPENVYMISVGSSLKYKVSGRFPLNMTTGFVKTYDGENDGLVGRESFAWGREYIHIMPKGKRGISHADMIDLNRENIPGFDVREFYVGLVHNLKERGL